MSPMLSLQFNLDHLSFGFVRVYNCNGIRDLGVVLNDACMFYRVLLCCGPLAAREVRSARHVCGSQRVLCLHLKRIRALL
jgi:hypothetical protein